MNAIVRFYYSSIGKKLVVGLTGFFLIAYLVIHLIGNLLLYRNDHGAAFNTYAEILPQVLVIRIIEIGLFLVFLFHIITAIYTWWQNRTARPTKYKVNKPQANSALTSRWMMTTGSIVFIFIVIHMRSFWFPSRFGSGEESMYQLVVDAFRDPLYSWFYVVTMFLLGLHLHHGFQSAFQTFGLRNKKYTPWIDALAVIFWLLIPAAFASIPLYFLLKS